MTSGITPSAPDEAAPLEPRGGPSASRGGPSAVLFDQVLRVRGELRGAADPGELFSRVADRTCEICGFDRGLVVGVERGHLSATDTGALDRVESDRLRRLLLARPVPLEPGTAEAAVIRRASGTYRPRRCLPSPLAVALGLKNATFAAIVPDAITLGLIVVERSSGGFAPGEEAMLETIATIAGLELARIVQRERARDLLAEVRQFSVVSEALAREACDAPAHLRRGHDTRTAAFPGAESAGARASALLSDREARIATLLAEGRSNREIAEALTVSLETVKSHVKRILRKLGAANRAEAVSVYLRLGEQEVRRR